MATIVLAKDRSVASGRTMAADRRRQGTRTEAVHAGSTSRGRARRGLAQQQRRWRRGPRREPELDRCRALGRHPQESRNRPRPFPTSSRRSCAGWSSGRPIGRRLGARDQVRRLSHAAARRGRQGRAAHPQGTRLDREICRDREGGGASRPTASSTARSSRSTSTARPISPRCRPRCRRSKTDDLIFFAFDLLFDGRRGPAPAAPVRAQGAAAAAA